MIETLALETFSHIFPPNMTFKKKFLLAFMISNTFFFLVFLLTFKILGWVKKREKAKLGQNHGDHNENDFQRHYESGIFDRRGSSIGDMPSHHGTSRSTQHLGAGLNY